MDRSSRSSTKRQRGKKRKPPRKPRKRKQPRRNKTRFVQTAAHGTGGVRHWNTPCPTRLFIRGWRRFPDAFDYPLNRAAILTCQHSTRSAANNPAGRGGIGGHPWCTCRPCSRGYACWSGPGNRRPAVENPGLSLTYSKSTPNYHEIVDFPFDISGSRSARIRSAEATRLASQYRFRFERSAAALDADTTYTRALAAREHVRLARRTAKGADSLRKMAIVRRDAGDA